MHKFNTPRLRRVDEVDAKFLTFKLTPEQKARLPKGKKIVFRKSTHPQKGKGYRQFMSRAEYTSSEPGKRGRAVAIASKLLGVIWDDDPEWIYETDKSKSSIKARRVEATKKAEKSNRLVAGMICRMFSDSIEYEQTAVLVKKIPVPLFLAVAVLCASRGITDATSVANYWNQNLNYLRKVLPHEELNEISHDSVRRIYLSLKADSVERFLKNFYEWLPKWLPEDARRHIAIDGQTCRSSRHVETNRRMMLLNAVDVTAGKLCMTHTMIDTKSNEPKYVPDILEKLNVEGALVSLDALSTNQGIASEITRRGGFYMLAVKGNQMKLEAAIKAEMSKVKADVENSEELRQVPCENDHYRNEKRHYVVLPANRLPQELRTGWIGLDEGCIIQALTTSFRSNRAGEWSTSREIRYFITNHPYQDGSHDEWLAECIRGHWGVESFHWTMDMLWQQDYMQCKHPAYLNTREAIAKLGHNLLKTFQQIDKKERGLSRMRSEKQLQNEVGITVENGLIWMLKAIQERESRQP